MQDFAEALKTWRKKQDLQSTAATSCTTCEVLDDDQLAAIQTFVDATNTLIARLKVL